MSSIRFCWKLPHEGSYFAAAFQGVSKLALRGKVWGKQKERHAELAEVPSTLPVSQERYKVPSKQAVPTWKPQWEVGGMW